MATVTTLALQIVSHYSSDGTRASNSIQDMDNHLKNLDKSLNTTVGRLKLFSVATLQVAPAIVPVTNAVAGLTAATAAMAVGAGTAGGIYGAAMAGAIKSTLEMQKSGEKLSTSQKEFIAAHKGTKDAWTGFVKSTQDMTLKTATVGLEGVTNVIKAMPRVVEAVHPVVMKVANAFKDWTERKDGLDRFFDVIEKYGVPALDHLLTAGRHVLTFLGVGFRAFAPMGLEVAKSLERGAAALADWAKGGGFERWIASIRKDAGPVKETLKDIWDAVKKLFNTMQDSGPKALSFISLFAKMITAMDPSTIVALVNVFLLWKSPILFLIVTIPGLTGLITAFLGALNPQIIYAVAAAFVVLRVAFMLMNTALLTTPLGWLIMLLMALAVAIVIIATKTTWFQTAWKYTWNAIKEAVSAVWTALQVAWDAFINAMITAWQAVSGALVTAWNAVWNAIATAVTVVWNALQTAWNAVVTAFSTVWTTVSTALKTAWDAVWNALKTAAEAVWNALKIAWDTFINALQTVWTTVSTALKTAWDAVWNALKTAAEAVWNALKLAWETFINALQTVWTTVSTALKTAWDAVWNALKTAAEAVWNALKLAWETFINALQTVWTTVSTALKTAWDAVWNALKTAAEAVWNVLKLAWETFINALHTVWTTVSTALKTAWDAVWNALKTAAEAVWNALKLAWETFINALQTVWTTVSTALKTAWDAVWNALKTAAEAVWNALKLAWETFINALQTVWTTVSTALKTAWDAVWNALKTAAEAVWNALKLAWETFLKAIQTAWTTISTALKTAWDAAWKAIETAAKAVWDALKTAWDTLLKAVQTAWTTVSTALKAAWDAAWKAVQTAAKAVWDALKAAWDTFLKAVQTAWTTVSTALKTAWDTVWKAIQTAVKAVWDAIKGAWNDFLSAIQKAWDTAGDKLKGAVKAVWDAIKKVAQEVWHQVGEVIQKGINGIIGIINKVGGLINKVSSAVGLGDIIPKIDTVDLNFRYGGVVGEYAEGGIAHVPGNVRAWHRMGAPTGWGFQGGGVVPPLPSPGPGIGGADPLATAPNDKDLLNNQDDDDGGGILGIVKDVVKTITGATGVAGLVLGFLAEEVFTKLLDAATDVLTGWANPAGKFGEVLIAIVKKLIKGAIDFLKDKNEEAKKKYEAMAVASSQSVQAWAPLVLKAMAMVGMNPNQLGRFLALMQAESGGNPNAINLTDSNAKAGIPSQGLMQVIPPTFAANHVAGTSNNILDPLANIAAAAKYIMTRYGGNVPGSPYATGTLDATPGTHLVGEQGPELMGFIGSATTAPAVAQGTMGSSIQDTVGQSGLAGLTLAAETMAEAMQVAWADATSATTVATESMDTSVLAMIQSVGTDLPATFTAMVAELVVQWATLRDTTLVEMQTWLTETIPAWFTEMDDLWTLTWETMVATFVAQWALMRDDTLTEMTTWFTVTIPAWFTEMDDLWTLTWETMVATLVAQWAAMRDATFAEMTTWFTVTIPGWLTTLSALWLTTWTAMTTNLTTQWNTMRDGPFAEFNTMMNETVPAAATAMNTAVTQQFQEMSTNVVTAMQAASTAMNDFVASAQAAAAAAQAAAAAAAASAAAGAAGGGGGGAVGGGGGAVGGSDLTAALAAAGNPPIIQGPYSSGALSAGTHTGGGVVDVPVEYFDAMIAAGFIGWLRVGAAWAGNEHAHMILPGTPDLSPQAAWQVQDYYAGGTGLGIPSNLAKGTDWASSGWHIVGERGPEFESTGRMMDMLRCGRERNITVNDGAFQIDLRYATLQAVEKFRQEVIPEMQMMVEQKIGKGG